MVADDTEVDTLTDSDLQSEIELVGELVVAASASDAPLSLDEVDRVLGVRPDGVRPDGVRPDGVRPDGVRPHEAGPATEPEN
jgi:hypothetical protein